MSEEVKLKNEDKTLWTKVKEIFIKYQKLIITITILLIIINIQNPQSIYNYVQQKGGDPENIIGNAAKGKDKSRVSRMFSGLGSVQSSAGNKLKAVGNINVFTSVMGWMLGFLKTFMMFCGLVIALAVLPALPLFIFMLILFFILRARMSFIKEL